MSESKRPVLFLGSSQKDLMKLPEGIRGIFAQGLYEASLGKTPRESKALKGFGGRCVLELRADQRSDTYRAVYTVRYKKAVYVLHVFKKKSKCGISTPKKDQSLIESRLKDAAAHYKRNFG